MRKNYTMDDDYIRAFALEAHEYRPFQDSVLMRNWISALRENTYKQGRNVLRDNDNSFCCLGVLCDVVDPNGWQSGTSVYSHTGSSVVPPRAITAQLQLQCFNPIVRMMINGVDKYFHTSALNDTFRLSFDTIADIIEENIVSC